MSPANFNLQPRQFPYGHSKYLAEKEVRKATAAGLPGIIVNPSVVLGPRDVNMISGSIIVEAARGRLRVYPPGGVNYVAAQDVERPQVIMKRPKICRVIGRKPGRPTLHARSC